MKRKNYIILSLGLVFTLTVLPGFSWGQELSSPKAKAAASDNGLHKGWQQGKHKGWNKEDMLKLKSENPEKFNQIVTQKLEGVRKKLEDLKTTDPEKYGRIIQKVNDGRLAKLIKLRQEDPEKFKEIVQKRREAIKGRLEKLKVENPERYERIISAREKIREFINNHPVLRERLEKRKGSFRDGRRIRQDKDDSINPPVDSSGGE